MGKENQMEMESQSLSCLFSQRMPNASTISQPILKGRNKTSSLEACKRKEKKKEGERECVCVWGVCILRFSLISDTVNCVH